ncbi:hypothetical protein POM88_005671 [Heracleum sosnowskyi]|uniref:PORR domain-containing protein n=1 Tax=Heracleum sosnowskyi TaxID=360622 RepID=A0AAD8N5S2_9APIA|nr:hypothetical protein POM88_005671 [Heracleum sosnowskyi]
MTGEKTVPFQSLYNLKWDLGLLDDFDRNLIRKYPDCFRVVKGSNGLACLKLLKWDDEFVVSALQRGDETVDLSVSGNGETELRKFKRGKMGIDLEEWKRNEQFWLIGGTSAHLAAVLQGLLKVIAIAVGVSRTIYSIIPQWSRLLGGVFFSFWDLAHLYPFAKGLMGRRGRTPTIVFVWSGLIAITISLLWIAIEMN